MDFKELLKNRRSCRNFLDKEVSTELLKEIINECILAPNSGNVQSWSFSIIQNKELMRIISDKCKEESLSIIKADPDSYLKKYENLWNNDSFNVFYNSPCFINFKGNKSWKNLDFDCTLAACYFMLSASNKGLATCWINQTRVLQDENLLRDIGVKLPEERISVSLAIGYPVKISPIPKRNKPNVKIITSRCS